MQQVVGSRDTTRQTRSAHQQSSRQIGPRTPAPRKRPSPPPSSSLSYEFDLPADLLQSLHDHSRREATNDNKLCLDVRRHTGHIGHVIAPRAPLHCTSRTPYPLRTRTSYPRIRYEDHLSAIRARTGQCFTARPAPPSLRVVATQLTRATPSRRRPRPGRARSPRAPPTRLIWAFRRVFSP